MSGRKPTAAPGLCECHGKPSAACPRNRVHVVTPKEQHAATVAYFARVGHATILLGPKWLMCHCVQGPQPVHQAHNDYGTL